MSSESSTEDAPRARYTRTQAGVFLAGGTEGNSKLTAATGLLLVLLLAVVGITIVFIGRLLSVHLFVGMLLIPPVLLKLGSTGYRFVRYYTHDAVYVRKGPPPTPLRLLAPLVVLCTIAVFATGVLLLVVGPHSSLRNPLVLLHKVSFFAWLATAGLHVLGHLPDLARILDVPGTDSLRALELPHPGDSSGSLDGARAGRPSAAVLSLSEHERTAGRTGRLMAMSAALVAGAVLAILVLPLFHPWLH